MIIIKAISLLKTNRFHSNISKTSCLKVFKISAEKDKRTTAHSSKVACFRALRIHIKPIYLTKTHLLGFNFHNYKIVSCRINLARHNKLLKN